MRAGGCVTFSQAHRDEMRARLLARARADGRISGAALTGAAAAGAADRWSDIDLFFGVAGDARDEVLAEWSAFLYQELGALHHFDLHAGPAIYRAFLLPECLEVDLAFTPETDFGARGASFRALFGEVRESRPATAPNREHLIGLAWHHALHARICIERNKPWQAEYWISALRDHTLALACIRLGRVAVHAKGVDALPAAVTAPFAGALVHDLAPSELRRALGVAAALFLAELRQADAGLARRLEGPLLELAPAST